MRALACALMFLALPASAFTLAKTNFDGGWPGDVVTFYYDSSNCPDSVITAIENAMDLWESVPTSSLKLKVAAATATTPAALVGGTAPQVPVIVCDPNFDTTTPSADSDAVAGYGFFNFAGGHISYGGLVLNVQAGKAANISTFSANRLQTLLAHEMGHVLGLGHSEYQPALMYYNIAGKSEANLAQDDMDGITYLYPRDEFKDGMYGCGRVASGMVPPATGATAMICLLIPLFLLGLLRRREKLLVRAGAAAGHAAA